MEIPPESLDGISQVYQAIKSLSLEIVMKCHDPDYETTMGNVRRLISTMEEEAFQLKLFDLKAVEAF